MASNLRDRAAALPKMPALPVQYSSDKEPYRSNTLIRWHQQEAEALRAQRDLLVEMVEFWAPRMDGELHPDIRAVLDAVRGKR